MSLADNWLSLVSQGYQTFESQAETPELRLSAKQMRFEAISSAVEIAIVPYPGRALLDMMVLASLNKATWDRHWLSTYGDVIQTVVLLLITAVPIIALGVWFVDYTMPGKARLLQLEAEFSAKKAELTE